MKNRLALVLAISAVSFCPTLAHADLIPPGGEGVQSCHNKKAGEDCENYLIDEAGQHKETGKCVEEKLDHLHFKFKAHLRCVSASVPKRAPSAAPSASAAPAPVPTPSSAPEVPSAAPKAPEPAPAAPAEPAKSGGCSWTANSEYGAGLVAFLLGLGILIGARRHKPAN